MAQQISRQDDRGRPAIIRGKLGSGGGGGSVAGASQTYRMRSPISLCPGPRNPTANDLVKQRGGGRRPRWQRKADLAQGSEESTGIDAALRRGPLQIAVIAPGSIEVVPAQPPARPARRSAHDPGQDDASAYRRGRRISATAAARRDLGRSGNGAPRSISAASARLAALAASWRRSIVGTHAGRPHRPLGPERNRTGRARRVSPTPVRLADERLTTVGAQRSLRRGAGLRQRALVSQAAAVAILQSWLDEHLAAMARDSKEGSDA